MILGKFLGCLHEVLGAMLLPWVMYFCLILAGKSLVSRMGKTNCAVSLAECFPFKKVSDTKYTSLT